MVKGRWSYYTDVFIDRNQKDSSAPYLAKLLGVPSAVFPPLKWRVANKRGTPDSETNKHPNTQSSILSMATHCFFNPPSVQALLAAA